MGHFGSRGGRSPSSSRISGTPGVAVRRASQPSGQWLDAFGNPCQSPNDGYSSPERVPAPATPAKKSKKNDNPDPANWKIVKAKENKHLLILQLNYPDCTNYEGNKILVFENITLIDLVNQKQIDPHFFPHSLIFKSPIARFEPTSRGWQMAETFVAALLTASL